MHSRSGDLVMAGVLGVLGAAMAAYSLRYGIFGKGGRIAPGFMPFVAGLALAAFSAWAFAETVVRGRRADRAARPATRLSGEAAAAPADDETGTVEEGPPGARTGGKTAVVFALTAGAALLTLLTGFLIAFGLLVLVLLAAVEREPPWLAVAVSVGAVAVSWVVFVQLLGVPLPGGALHLLGS